MERDSHVPASEMTLGDVKEAVAFLLNQAPGGPGGTSDHGELDGLADDDHLQYLTDARGAALFSPLAHDHDADYAALSHTHDAASVTSGTFDDARIPAGIARDSEVTTAISNHEAAANPHPTYLTQAEGEGLFHALTTDMFTQAEANAHTAAADPHPGYRLESVAIAAADVAADVATQAELDAHVNDTASAHLATAIEFTPAGTIASTTVQAAIEEVASEAGGGGPHVHAGEDITTGEVALARLPSALLTGAEADAAYAALGHTHSIYSVTSHNHDAAYEAKDADLTAIAGLSPSNDDFLQRKSGAWTNRTVAQVLADLAVPGTTFQPLDADLTALAALATNAAGRSVLILTDPNADRILFWDDSAGAFAHLTPGAGLTLAGTDITAGAAVASVTAGPVSVTTTAQIQLATVSINTLAGRRYKIDASVRFLKDTGTTTRAETLRLRRTDGSGTILTESGGASSAVASSPFGAALTYVDTPGAATPFTWHLSAINFASSTISAALISMNVIELS